MDLTKKYMEKQGTLGYLHKREFDKDRVVVAYAKEGCHPEYHWCLREEAEKAVEVWGSTGELALPSFNCLIWEEEKLIVNPDTVMIFEANELYFRRMYPPKDGE